MRWLKNRGNRLMVALLAGLAGAVLLAGMPGLPGMMAAVKEPGGMMAWWGTMYPKFCFAEVQEDDEESAGDGTVNGTADETANEMQWGQMKTKLWIVEFLKG
ncbi:hypothetical protein NXH76_14870 [Blautia schinkii]|nr:hypothetical protein [Blautia schinkii]